MLHRLRNIRGVARGFGYCALAIAALWAPPSAFAEISVAVKPEAQPYDEKRDAAADVDAALSRARAQNKQTIVVFGANWCHDSKSLAGRFATPRFQALLGAHYELVYVDVGKPQTGAGRNLEIARRLGFNKIKGTPTVALISADGVLLNRRDAPRWRNAASRSDDMIFDYFSKQAKTK